MYVVGVPEDAFHASMTVPAAFETTRRPLGAPGAEVHVPPTVSTDSLEAPLLPEAFDARTRT